MSSQGPVIPDVLERLAEWSAEEIENNLDLILPELLSHLGSDDKGLVLQSVYALLVTCLPSLPVERAHKSLLHHAMPAVQLLFKESLEGIKLRLHDQSALEFEDIAETLSSLLQVCNELLKCIENVLQYIVSKDRISISSVPSVPKTVALLMLQTFKHCSESETLYKDLFSSVSDVLGALFRQCHQVQCQFFAITTTNISYDSSLENDVDHLIDVLEILSEVGQHVMSLDVKTMAEQWKGFAKIVQLYLEPLRQHFNISFPVNFLCQEICNNLEQLVCKDLQRDVKTTSRLIKTTSFILKIVVKLCEQFGSGNDCLRDCQSSLFDLLLVLHRYSPPFLIQQNVQKNLIDEMERHLIVAADPLLSHLISEINFREEFFRKSWKIKGGCNDSLSHLSLILSTMKRLGALNADDRGLWISPSKQNNIIGSVLEVLKFSHCDLSSLIWVPAVVKSGQLPRNCDLYEALCCQCAGLMLSLNNDQFQAVESLLLDSLVEPHVWPALFSGDVWCICARAGSSELVLDQLLYFADIASALEPANLIGRPESKIMSSFIHRMCSFLGTKGKQMLVEKFPPSDHPLLWYTFGVKNFPQKAHLSQALIASCRAHIENFLSSSCDVSAFLKMLSGLYGLSTALESIALKSENYIEICEIVPIFISLWQYACRGDLGQHLSSSDHFASGPKWLRNLLDVLCKCAGNLVQVMTNDNILQVLNSLDGVVSCCNTSMKISVTHILHGLATKPLETYGQEVVCSKISCLFAALLADEDPLVVEEVLETFEYFAHFTAHETIVAQTATVNSQIQDIVTRYLQKEIPGIGKVENINSLEYLSFQGSVSCEHKCSLKKVRMMSPISPEKSVKKIRLENELSPDLSDFLSDDLLTDFVDKDITDAVSRISLDSQYLISESSFQALPESTQRDLKRVVNDLCKFTGIGKESIVQI